MRRDRGRDLRVGIGVRIGSVCKYFQCKNILCTTPIRSKLKILLLSLLVASFFGYISFYTNTTSDYSSINTSKAMTRVNEKSKRYFYRIKEKSTTSLATLAIIRNNNDSVNLNSNTNNSKFLLLLQLTNNTDVGQKQETDTGNNRSRRRRRHFTVYDGGGFGSTQTGNLLCSSSFSDIEIMSSRDAILTADFSFFHMNAPRSSAFHSNRRNNYNESSTFMPTASSSSSHHYTMVFTMESEVHSFGGDTWSNADFRMWYNLDASFPEPATYFDTRVHLNDLMSAPIVDFDNKEQEASIVWIVSNCNAFNGREVFMKKLMDRMSVHSYGNCLKNKNTHTSEHMKGIGLDFILCFRY